MTATALLEACNAPLNAFLAFDEGAAAGEGVLTGVTLGVKANIMVRGMPFHAGLEAFSNRIAERDASVVAALRREGAEVLGILNMEEAAFGSKTDNPWSGATQNPHRLGFSPGGSSGGSGAAVAAGLCDLALGSDTMGSVRIPAAHCGIYGFKPATDRISQDGLEPADLSLDAIGLLSRDLALLERAARVMSDVGEEPIMGSGATLDAHGVECHPAVERAFVRALSALDQAPRRARLSHPNSRIRYAGFISVARALGARLEGVAFSTRLRHLLGYGARRDAGKWEEDRRILGAAREEVAAIVDEFGFLIMPTVPNPPFAHAEDEPAAQADFTCLANIAGLPALTLPMGRTEDALPLGVQLVGPAGCEAGLFALGRQLHETLHAYFPPSDFIDLTHETQGESP